MPKTSNPPPFTLHPQLVEDCHPLGELGFCHLLLHRNASLPWFILVPETHLKDLLDLPAALRSKALDDAALVSRFIKEELDYPKVNFAVIGNVVPQMHLHVVGRSKSDPCWPAPVWGNLKVSAEWSPEQIASMQHGIQSLA
jgi:diadenosine tetraphosphate (Ap4A) HIT family hydrolase